MNLSCLNIRQEYARIDVKSQNAKLDIRSGLGEQTISTQPAVLDINNENGRLEVDNYPCRYARGIKNNADFSRDGAQAGMQALKDFTARIVNDTKQFAETAATASTAVANIALSHCRSFQPSSGLTLKYVDLPRYNYTPDKLTISYKPSKVNAQVAPARYENNSQPGSVNVSLAQQQSIRMWVSEGKFDTYA